VLQPNHNRHEWNNRLQTLLLVLAMLTICALAGNMLFGELGVWVALSASLVALLGARAAEKLVFGKLSPARRTTWPRPLTSPAT
jgi:hypothetical protein